MCLSRIARSLFILVCVAAWARPESPFPGAQAVDALIQTAIADGKIPGAVLLVGHKGTVIYRKAYGKKAVVPAAEPMTVDTIFDCASLTKVVATTPSVMKLFEEGRIRLSDRVTEYLPQFQNGQSDITIRDLMTHYSGLRPDLTLEPPWSGYETGIAKALADPPSGPRETKFVYSDINFLLMGEIVHRVSGQMLDEFARDHIFLPLGMNETQFRPPAALLLRIAPTEELKTGEILRGVVDDPTARFMGGVAGDAGLFSTADDLSRFCQMMLDRGANPAPDGTHPDRILGELTVDLFTSPQSPAGLPAIRGLGWDIQSPFSGNRGELFPAGRSYGHTGYTGTSLWIDPASETYVILLTNAVHPHAGKNITPLRKSIATAVAAAVGYSKAVQSPVLTGLDVLEAEHFQRLAGKRVGLITNPTGIDRAGRRNIDVMRAAGVKITALFSPEHGFLAAEDHEDVAGTIDQATGIRVFSLFGKNALRPTPAMLRDIDVMVFDIADVGARFYTYATTMAYAMESCAKNGKTFMVLDRPNPLTGLHVEGPMLNKANESFVGYFPLPLRHGMTMAELARMFNAENKINADLQAVPMAGWHRGDWFDAGGLPWVDPSPNIRNLNAALLYPALGMLEYAENYSVGRGTREPFEIVGAAWINGQQLSDYLNSREIPGVRTYPVRFRPDSSHYQGTSVEGLRFIVTNRDVLDTARLGLELAGALNKFYPGKIEFTGQRKLIGNDETISRLKHGDDAKEIRAAQEKELEAFRTKRLAYLLYE